MLVLRELLLFAIYFTLTRIRFSSSESTAEIYLNALNEFSTTTKTILQERLNEIRMNIESQSRDRKKRAILIPATTKQDAFILKNVQFVSEMGTPAVLSAVANVKTSRNLYLLGASRRNLDGSRKSVMNPVWIWDDATKKYQRLTIIETPSAIGVEGFVINDEAYFIFAINTADKLLDLKKRSSKLYKIDANQKITSIQTFVTTGLTKWKSFKSEDDFYLMEASAVRWKRLKKSHRDYSKLIVPKTSREVKLYKWTGVAFSKMANILTSQSTSVDAATLMGRTFIAIVNQTFMEKHVESAVLIYELSHGQIKLIQRINGWTVSDVHFVRAQNQLYLAIAYNFRVQMKQIINQLDSLVLRFNGLFFVKYQAIPTDCALQWTTLRGPRNEYILHLQNAGAPDTLFQLIDETWTPLNVTLSIQGNRKIGLDNEIIDDASIVAVPTNVTVRFIELKFINESVDSLKALASTKCRQLLVRLNDFKKQREQFERSDRRMASLTQRQELRGLKHFESVGIRELKLEKMIVKNTNIYEKILKNRTNKIDKKLSQLPDNLGHYLKKNAPQTIHHKIVVNNIKVDKLTARNVQFNVVNDRLFCQFLSNVVHMSNLGIPDERRNLRFDHIVYQEDVTLVGTLNTVHIPDGIVFLDKPNRFTAKKTFAHSMVVRNDLLVTHSVNRVQPRHILLTHERQVIRKEKHVYGDIVFLSLDLLGDIKVGDISWKWFVNETMRIDAPMVIKGEKTITNDVLVLGDLDPTGLVNGVDIGRMFRDVIPLNQASIRFSKQIEFSHVDFEKSLLINGRLNDVFVPRDLVLVNQGPWNLDLDLHQPLHLRKIDVTGSINGILVDKDHIMTRSHNQTVTGEKSFADIQFERDLTVSGFLNSYDLDVITRKIKSEAVLVVDAIYPRMTVENLQVSGTIPVDLHRLLYKTVKINRDHEFRGHVQFTKLTHFRHNLDFPPTVLQHLVPVKKASKLFLKNKTFHHVIFENNIVVRGTVNNIDLNEFLKNILMKTGDQTVNVSKTFTNLIDIRSDSFVTGSINNVKLTDLVKINENSKLDSKLTFSDVLTVEKNAIFQKTIVRHNLNEKPIDTWFQDTLTTTGDQDITASKKFTGVLNIGEKENRKDLYVSGNIFLRDTNLEDFVDDVVLVDETNIINSETIFDVDVTIENLETKFVDNINIIDLFQSALRLDEPRRLEIDSDVVIQDLQTQFINDIDIDDFFANVVYTSDRKLPKNLHFRQVISDEIKLTGLFQGVHFVTDVVTTDQFEEIEFYGPKTFQRVEINKLQMRGTINGIDLVKLIKTIVKQGSDQKIDGVLWVDKLHVKNNISVKGLVSGHNLTQFMSQAWFIDEHVVIKGNIAFNNILYNPTNPSDLHIRGLLDNVDLNKISKNVMTIEDYQEIPAPITFKNKVILNNVIIRDNLDLVDTSYVNGINLPKWEAKIMKINKEEIVTAPQTFVNSVSFNNLVVRGKMNDIYLDDIMRLDKEKQRIYNTKVFEQVIVENLEIKGHGHLMGVDVEQWKEDALLIDQGPTYVFKDDAQFETLIFDDAVTFESSINQIELAKIVTVSGKQQILGRKTFENDVIGPRWTQSLHISGTVNNVQFSNLIDALLTIPLQYPCRREFVYSMGGCYRIYPGNRSCDNDKDTRRLFRFDEHERQLLRNMRLVERSYSWVIPETNDVVSVCYYHAHLKVLNKTILTGKFTFTNRTNIVSGLQRSISLTPVEIEFKMIRDNYSLVIDQMQIGAAKLRSIQDGMCAKLNSFDTVLRNAYRPLGPFQVLQTLNIWPQRIIPLELNMTKQVMSFLLVENDKISLFAWDKDQFAQIESITFPTRNWLKIELNSYHDYTNREIVVFLARNTRGCPDGFVHSIDILTFKLDNFRLAKEISSISLLCTRPRNVQIAIVRSEIYIISGIKNEIKIRKMNEPSVMIQKAEPFDIYYVQLIDSNGMFAVANRYNGISLVTIYSFDAARQQLEHKFSIQDLPNIRQISALKQSSSYYLTFLTRTQIQLVEFSSSSFKSSSKQIIDLECPTDMHWVTTSDFTWLVVGSCGCNSYVYSFTGYLNRLYEVERGIAAAPHLFHMDREIFLISQLQSCFEESEKIAVLRAFRKGPHPLEKECQMDCSA
uniref:VWFD domain-containing protein n=1 Tax=Strigamia maritima TaxID=126957 RepID=T1J1P9_STRMM